jgi:hypothetical protein
VPDLDGVRRLPTVPPMTSSRGYTCACCEQVHDGLPPAVGIDAPDYWDPAMRRRRRCRLTTDTCVIDGENFFIRAVLLLPVVDAEQDFEWGIWVSQSEANFRFRRKLRNRFDPERVSPTFGWLSNELPGYEPSTLEVTVTLQSDPSPGMRPFVDVEPSDHPLSVEQREGITVARVRELVAPFAPGS